MLGLGLGVLVVGPAPEPAPPATGDDAPGGLPDSPLDGTLVAAEEDGISHVVPGFPDALVAVARTTGSTLDYVLWPVAGSSSVRSMTGGGDVRLDVTSQFVAVSSALPDGGGSLLSMGRPNSVKPVAGRVGSYAWHDSATGWLSYTVGAGDASRLMTVKADFAPKEVVSLDEAGMTVVGWGDWGWAMQRSTPEIVLFNSNGEFKDTETGTVMATHPTGWMFAMEGNDPKLVSAGGGVRRLAPIEGIGSVERVEFSPDGLKLAVLGSRAVGILDLETDELTRLGDFAVAWAAWSSDSRFVVTSAGSGVVVYDLDNGDSYPILREYAVVAAGVVPLRGS